MRPFEILLVVFTVVAAVCLLTHRWKRTARLLVAGSVAVALAHAIFEGAHWQMIPAYLAIAILCLAAWMPGVQMRRSQIAAVSATLLLVAASALLSFMLPMFSLPNPTGQYPVGTTTLYFKDSARVEDAASVGGSVRELMVQLWYPAQPSSNRFASYREPRETRAFSSYQSVLPTHSRLNAPVARAGAPFPVILFNHGWGGRRTNDTYLTEELASHGYVVASIDHTYNAGMVAFPDGRIVHTTASSDIEFPDDSTEEKVRAIWNKELLKQAADQRFVLDRLHEMNSAVGTPWFGSVNTDLAGAIGFSFGGAASTEVCAEDPRVRASVNMDGWFFAAIHARGPNQPLLFIVASSEQTDANADPNAKTFAALNAEDSTDVESSLHKFGGYLLSLNGAVHNDFTDQPLVSPLRVFSHVGTIPAREMESIVRAYVLAFFDDTIRGGDSTILRARSSPFPEASLEVWPERKSEVVSLARSKGQ